MEPPARADSESVRDEKVKVLKAIPQLTENDVVRGQFRGYRSEAGVAPDSNVETFAAVRLAVNSWRWQGVPFYIRAGKCLSLNATEVFIRLRRPPAPYPSAALKSNYVRLRLVPDATIALGMMVLTPEQEISGQVEEMVASTQSSISEADAYERILGDAMVGDPTLFAREDYVEEAWRIVDPVVKSSTAITQYEPGTWGPAEMQQRIAPPEGWHNPTGGASPGENTLHAA